MRFLFSHRLNRFDFAAAMFIGFGVGAGKLGLPGGIAAVLACALCSVVGEVILDLREG